MGPRAAWFTTALLWAGAGYCWAVPLIWPRGVFGWGHYRLVDVFGGFLLVVAALEVTVLLVCPGRLRRSLAFRMVPATFLIILVGTAADSIYTMGFRQAYAQRHTDVWFDGVSHRDNLPDEELGFVRKPRLSWDGSPGRGMSPVRYATDENGFRNPPAQTRADVVFIGDSFTEAASVREEDTFVRQVANTTGLSVVNLGRGLYGPQQELIVLQRFGFSYHPRAVIWQVFEGNDLDDAQRFARWSEKRDPGESFALRYAKRSPLVRLVGLTQPSDFCSQPLSLPDDTRGQVALDYRYDPGTPGQDPPGLEELLRAIHAGHTLCKEKDIPLLVVFVPIKVRVLEPFVAFESEAIRDRFLPGGRWTSPDDFGTRLGAYCQSIGCSYVDTLDALRAAADKDCRKVYHLGQDTHLDVTGHRAVSDPVTSWLRVQGLARPAKDGAVSR